MTFYDYYSEYKNIDIKNYFDRLSGREIIRIIDKNNINAYDFLALLSPRAEEYLEVMAQKAHRLSEQHFGKTIQLFTPMYVANYCVNKCAYCSFNVANRITRKIMNLEEVDREARAIASTGLKHILFLTGESRAKSPVDYICDVALVLKKYFDSISIEIYPLTVEEYKRVAAAGVDGFCMYQEVYNEEVYERVHLAGPKKDYRFRLDAPDRACQAKMRSVSIGALLGLHDWRSEAFATGLHAWYLRNTYSDVEIAVGVPRIRPHVGVFDEVEAVSDRSLVQILLAYRLLLPNAGITITTREKPELRDNLIPLGVTKMSAGVTTEVGGHTSADSSDSQFEIADSRSVVEMEAAILQHGYQPVYKNWMAI